MPGLKTRPPFCNQPGVFRLRVTLRRTAVSSGKAVEPRVTPV
jgi:hypothetical protein